VEASSTVQGTAVVRTPIDITLSRAPKAMTLAKPSLTARGSREVSRIHPYPSLHQVRPAFRKRGMSRAVRLEGDIRSH